MEFLAEYGMFLLKAVTIVAAIVFAIGGIVAAASKGNKEGGEGGVLKVTKINDQIKEVEEQLTEELLDHEAYKALKKEHEKEKKEKAKLRKKEEKAKQKAKKTEKAEEVNESEEESNSTESDKSEPAAKRAFVLEFDGDVKASAVETMRKEITSILTIAEQDDEVVVKLESAGGMVHSYGLASSQLKRIRDKGLELTICVDKVAASGGYMMACTGSQILAAPFAIVGSIGVIAQLPNFNKLLKKHDVDIEMHTAGEYKRTLTMFGENTDEGRSKFKEDIADTHDLFKKFISLNRPGLEVDSVANGDVWYGMEAVENNLIDGVKTSDEYIMDLCQEKDVFKVSYEKKKSLGEKLGVAAQLGVENSIVKVLNWLQIESSKKGV